MLFWMFMYVCDLLLPLCMLGFGWVLANHPPKEIHDLFGYRTARSRQSKEAWLFAQQYFGKLWWRYGWATLILTICIPLFYLHADVDTVALYGTILCCVEIIPMLIPVYFTEKALKQHFGNKGNLK